MINEAGSVDTTITCAKCRRALDDDPGLTTRPPCPDCGSTKRNIPVVMTAAPVRVEARIVKDLIQTVAKSVEHNWLWIIVAVLLAIVSVLVKALNLPLAIALILAVVLTAAGIVAKSRASTRVIVRERVRLDLE